ncbi:MAG: ammonium transporter [Phycisphaerales bacterium]|nr:MAG: ammonium transporter [Phycisphaerales bacterium]
MNAGAEVVAVLAVSVYAAGMTFLIRRVVNAVLSVRVSPAEELTGLDISQHGESLAA